MGFLAKWLNQRLFGSDYGTSWNRDEKKWEPAKSSGTLSDFQNFDYQGAMDKAMSDASARFGIEYDANGNRITPTATDYTNQGAAAAEQIQSYSDWLAEHGINPMDISSQQEGIDALIAQLENPDDTQAWQTAAQMLGFDSPEEAQAYLANLRDNPGMSAEETALKERANQANIREMENRAKRVVQNALAGSGSTVRMLAAADEATASINNVQLKQQADLWNEQMARIAADTQKYAQMVQMQQMSYSDFMQQQTDRINSAIAGYETSISATMAEYSQYSQTWENDKAALEAQADSFYRLAALQQGIDQNVLDAAQQIYTMTIQPILDSLNAMLTAKEISQADFDGIMDIITKIALAAIGKGV